MCHSREPVVAVRGRRAARTGDSWQGGRGAKRRVSGDGHAVVVAEDSSVALPSARLRSGVRGERSEPSPDSEMQSPDSFEKDRTVTVDFSIDLSNLNNLSNLNTTIRPSPVG